MSPASSDINDWIEYKRLVLAELERLNECMDKLQDSHVSLATQIHECRTNKQEVEAHIAKIKKRMEELHSPATEIPEARWKFYAAIATVVGSAIVSIISLITAMLS
jgi:chromosome segregation ATPase